MNGIINWFARNPVAANLLMVFLVVSGAVASLTVKEEVFPEFSLDLVTIEVPYLGAAPEEVESAVAVRIEEAIQGIDGIKEITSTASEGMGTVQVELELGADTRLQEFMAETIAQEARVHPVATAADGSRSSCCRAGRRCGSTRATRCAPRRCAASHVLPRWR